MEVFSPKIKSPYMQHLYADENKLFLDGVARSRSNSDVTRILELYILPYSDLEINISHKTRQHTIELRRFSRAVQEIEELIRLNSLTTTTATTATHSKAPTRSWLQHLLVCIRADDSCIAY